MTTLTRLGALAAVWLQLCAELGAAPQLVPGVYGYGLDRAANPAGFGPGSRIIHVTTLEDNGSNTNPVAGSLRAAVCASGPRVVVFDLSGIIELASTLVIPHGEITVAGQTAPSPGIALHGAPLIVQAGNVLVEHIRVRPGDRWLPDPHTHNRDAVDVDGPRGKLVANVVFDHCTFAWALDEIASTWNDYEDVTFSRCVFAEPLYQAIHIDEGTFPHHLPPQVETLRLSPTGFSGTETLRSPLAVGGEYQVVHTDSDGDVVEYILPVLPDKTRRLNEHLVVGSITGPDRAKFRVEVRDPDDHLLQSSEVFDQYAPTGESALISHVSQVAATGFILPPNVASLKVRLIVSGRNPASTGWKLGVDLFALSQGHAMGPLFGSGKSGAGRLAVVGSVIAHVLERGPWANSKQFVFANNVLYNRRYRFLMIGHTDYWSDPIHVAAVGNTFIDGPSLIQTTTSPIARQKPPEGTQVYQADNVFDPGDRDPPAPLVDPKLAPYLVDRDPTTPGHGLAGFAPLPAREAFDVVLRSAGARPNDRDVVERRIFDEIARSQAIHRLADRPGRVRNSVAEAGGWPVYAQNQAHWSTPMPAAPNADDDHDGYTNIEEWLHDLAAQLEVQRQ
ncbi:MAG TPA: hypothetical protein VG734_02480 [Lacunisphaera sp.]|nr:hypothetical protein [Lacunisphaera sp.]